MDLGALGVEASPASTRVNQHPTPRLPRWAGWFGGVGGGQNPGESGSGPAKHRGEAVRGLRVSGGHGLPIWALYGPPSEGIEAATLGPVDGVADILPYHPPDRPRTHSPASRRHPVAQPRQTTRQALPEAANRIVRQVGHHARQIFPARRTATTIEALHHHRRRATPRRSQATRKASRPRVGVYRPVILV